MMKTKSREAIQLMVNDEDKSGKPSANVNDEDKSDLYHPAGQVVKRPRSTRKNGLAKDLPME